MLLRRKDAVLHRRAIGSVEDLHLGAEARAQALRADAEVHSGSARRLAAGADKGAVNVQHKALKKGDGGGRAEPRAHAALGAAALRALAA